MDQTGALYSLLVKCPDSDSRVKSYSPWLREQARAVGAKFERLVEGGYKDQR